MSAITVRDLSPDQRECFDVIVRWAASHGATQVLSMGGYAGTGKSTLVSLVAETLPPPVAFCAFTGKASSVLKRKLQAAGIYTVGTQRSDRDGGPSLEMRPYCGTIHSLIYRPCSCREPAVVEVARPCPEKECTAETSWVEAAGAAASVCAAGHRGLLPTAAAVAALRPKTFHVYPPKDPEGRCGICFEKGWLRRETLDRDYSLIIVDEASMVDDTMLRDLSSYQKPILAVGDHGQLPPVGGSGSLMKNPALRLERIHRQAEGNPIILLSKIVRETGNIPNVLPGSDDRVAFGRLRLAESLLEERYGAADAKRLLEMGLCCATNRRRVGMNVAIRRVRGTARTGRELPRAGEHVVCLKNMKPSRGEEPIYNGMRGVLVSDADPKRNVNARGEALGTSKTQLHAMIEFPDDGIAPREFDLLAAQFGRDKTFSTPEDLLRETGLYSFQMAGALFDFGFAMTCHKMQGSQYEDLVVVAERMGPMSAEDWTRWQYTAVTRAAERLTVLR
ncbi:MAG: AAA family ATPase [Patescibacteria group bacterium]|nr:AAA family ATPase [Patescibacteria group bacterium]